MISVVLHRLRFFVARLSVSDIVQAVVELAVQQNMYALCLFVVCVSAYFLG